MADKSAQEIRILYGEAVTVLPMTAAAAADRASGIDCKILMCLAADPDARSGQSGALQRFAERIGCTAAEVERAISYWRDAGVLRTAEPEEKTARRAKRKTPEETVREEMEKRGMTPPSREDREKEEAVEEKPVKTEKKPRRNEELPSYTLEELSELLEGRRNLSLFVDECQRAYGKMFNPREVSKLLGLVEYYSLDEEYVLTLLRYYGEKPAEERKAIGYVIKRVDTLIDSGIDSVDALSAHLQREAALHENEGQIRSIFGLGARAFTAKEKAAVLRWVGEFGFTTEMIRLAYERTVNATGKPSIPYAAKILERWHSEGYKTPGDVEAAESGVAGSTQNFNTDDFFEAALKRSYGSDYEAIYQKTGNDGQ